jgi:hypothetical protein
MVKVLRNFMTIQVIAGIEVEGLKIRALGSLAHGSPYATIDEKGGRRIAYFLFSTETIHFYPTSSRNDINKVNEHIIPWFKISENFNKIAKAWNDTNSPVKVKMKAENK